MRILSVTLPFTLILLLVACSSSDQETAKEEAHRDGREVSEEAKKAGQEIKKDANELSRQVDGAVQPAGQSASEKLAHLKEKANDAAARAGVDLEHAALLARVKSKLASDAGLDTIKNVDVTVTGTVVTLSGTVGNEYQKKSAVLAASQVQGVTRVQDKIAIED